MTEMVSTLAILFIVAGALVLLANQLSLSTVPFYILAGILASPFVDELAILDLAQWGIAFLVFIFGTWVDFSNIASVTRDSELAALAQFIAIGPTGFAVAYAIGLDPLNALYFAVAASLSSTLVGMESLELTTGPGAVHDRLASSLHFFDDIVAVGLILILSAEVFTGDAVAANLGYGLILVVAGLLIYRYGFTLLVRAAEGFEELVLIGTISILLIFIAAAEFLGISIVVGAFAAGLAIRRDGAESLGVFNGIQSIRDFFVAIFFVTVGALVTMPTALTLVFIAFLVLLVVVVNPLITILALVYEGYTVRTAHKTGTKVNQISEMSIIIAIEAFIIGTIVDQLFNAIIIAAAITMILQSFIQEHERNLYDSVLGNTMIDHQEKQIEERSSVSDTLENHVVILGYGRQGRQILETCKKNDQEHVVIETDPIQWDDVRARAANYVLGDALFPYTWEKANISEADIVVSTADTVETTQYVLNRQSDCDCDVFVRARSAEQAKEWLDMGATYVSVPDLLASEQLIEHVVALLAEDQSLEELKDEHHQRLSLLDEGSSDIYAD